MNGGHRTIHPIHFLVRESALQKRATTLSLSHSMQVTLLKSKIHRAAVTGASLHYEGSLTVSADIAKMVGLLPYEKILVGNLQNGERFETYVIYGTAGRIEWRHGSSGRNRRSPNHHELCAFDPGRSENSSSARRRARC